MRHRLKQLVSMVKMQYNMNAVVNHDWIHAGYPFLRAIVVEGAEAMEHHGWKWWKSQTADLPNTRLELVDIWHFALSHYWLENSHFYTPDAIARRIEEQLAVAREHVVFDNNVYYFNEIDFVRKMELMIGLAASKRFDVSLFTAAMNDIGMGWDQLYTMYVAKNVLNVFRQKNGYKTGTYKKQWSGVEDNEFLLGYMHKHPGADEDTLHNVLTAEYARLGAAGLLA